MTQDQIRDLRYRLGLSQMAFAVKLGVSVDAVRKWEQGDRTPGADNQSLLDDMRASTDKRAEVSE